MRCRSCCGSACRRALAALREASVLLAAVLATVLLGERFGWQRAVGTAVVVAGVMALRFG